MSALPADIGLYTVDGQVVQAPSTASSMQIQATHPNARTTIGNEFQTFFDNVSDAQTMLNEKAAYLTVAQFPHLAIDIQDSIDIGTTIPIAPSIPCFLVIDEPNGVNFVGRCRSYAHQFDGDRYALEVLP